MYSTIEMLGPINQFNRDTISNPDWGEEQYVLIEYYEMTEYWRRQLGNSCNNIVIAYPTFQTPGNGDSALRTVEAFLSQKAYGNNTSFLHVLHPTTLKGKNFCKRIAAINDYLVANPGEVCYYKIIN